MVPNLRFGFTYDCISSDLKKGQRNAQEIIFALKSNTQNNEVDMNTPLSAPKSINEQIKLP